MNMTSEPIIHVGIMAASEIQFELNGSFELGGELVSSGIYSAILNEGVISYTCKGRKSKASQVLEFIPKSSSSTFILKDVMIGIGFHWEQRENQEFDGGLILLVERGNIRVVNAVPLECYLKSVISSEMSAMNDRNLLNAHAIVSRSWLFAQILNKTKSQFNSLHQTESEIIKWYDREDHDTFDVCADDHCQRYQGVTKVISANAQQAIESTRGQVLMYHDEICDARFSKCCGGVSEDFENVWQPVIVPYLVAVPDRKFDLSQMPLSCDDFRFFTTSPEAFCNTSDPEILSQVLIDFDRTTTNFYRWEVDYTQLELSDLLRRKSGFDFGEIIDLIPLERGNSGRMIRLKIVGTKREMIVGKELEIRKWLSDSHLYSSAFVVEKEISPNDSVPSKFKLHGAGWGHGVGMCQIGAAVMSQKGYSSSEILGHYFKKASIETIYK